MRYLLLVFQILILEVLPFEISAQSMKFETRGLPPLKLYSPKEYGASRQSWGILQDDRGILFFGNNEGLLTFDGSNWELIPSPNGTVIRSLAMDEYGVIYYGGRNDLGYVSSDSLGHLSLISLRDKIPLENGDFDDVWEINYLNGSVIFQTYNYLFWVDTKEGKNWEDCSFKVIKASSRVLSSAVIDNACYVYMKDQGLSYLVNDRLQLFPDDAFVNQSVMDMLPWFPNSSKAKMLLLTRRNGLFS